MGKWAKALFGQETIGPVGIVLAGTSSGTFEKNVLSLFDEVVFKKDAVYHIYLAKKDGITYPLVFNVYGAPAVMDLLTEMHDGGCTNIIFVGYAYGGFKDIDVGAVVVPDKAYHFDGVYSEVDPERRIAVPDQVLVQKLRDVFDKNKFKYVNGDNISVPAVTFQPKHANDHYKNIDPTCLEMEMAAFFSRAQDIGVRAAAAVIISDNKSTAIGDASKKELRRSAKLTILKHVIGNLQAFALDKLPMEKPFVVDDYLASIIATDEESPNIYKEQK